MRHIKIDPNVRVRGNQTYAGFEDANCMLATGDTIVVYEPEMQVEWDAVVTDIDDETRIIYLYLHWDQGRSYV